MNYTIFPLPNSVMLILAASVAFLLTYIFTFGVIAFCLKVGWVEFDVSFEQLQKGLAVGCKFCTELLVLKFWNVAEF